MNCPHCGKEFNVGQLLGMSRSDKKAEAARLNGKKGGRPKKIRKNLHVETRRVRNGRKIENSED